MKMVILFITLLTLAAATFAAVTIASNVSLGVRIGLQQEVVSLPDFGDIQPCGDPVDGGGGGPGVL